MATLWPPLVLFAASVALFLPSLPYEFLNWDDEVYILRNPWLLNLTLGNVFGIFVHPYFANYHPLTMLSYMVDFHWWGYDPPGYRFANILLHGATVAAAFGLFRALGVRPIAAFLFLLLFAVHPLRVESVVWISERKDVLCGLFSVLSAWCWVAASRRVDTMEAVDGVDKQAPPLPTSFILHISSFLLLLLALLSKAMAVTLPLVFLAHDLLLARDRVGRRLPVYLLMFAMSGLFMWLNLRAQTEAIAVAVPWSVRLRMAAWAPLHYSLKTVWPAGLSPLYPNEAGPFLRPAWALLGGVYTALLLAVAVGGVRRLPYLSFGLFSAAILLGPVTGIVAFGSAYAADRYSYLPSVFLFAGIAAAFFRRRDLCGDALAAGVFVCGIMALLSSMLMPAWRSSETVWARVLAVYPESNKARFNAIHAVRNETDGIGIAEDAGAMADIPALSVAGELQVFALIRAGRHDEAIAAAGTMREPAAAAFWKMLALNAAGRGEEEAAAARSVLALADSTPEQQAAAALALARIGHHVEALAALEALDQPTLNAPAAWGLVARAAFERGDSATAEAHARRSLGIFPADPAAVRLLAELPGVADRLSLYRRAARHPAAEATLRAWVLTELWKANPADTRSLDRGLAVEPKPDSPLAEQARVHVYIGYLAEEARRPAVAAGRYQRALDADPGNLDALQNLAILHLQAGRKNEGISLLERALAISPQDQMIIENLRRARGE